MLTASEAAGKPRRWISGLELTERQRVSDDGTPLTDDDGEPLMETVSPIDDIDTVKTMISENENTKFGQLPGSDLQGFKDGVQVILSQIMAVSALPSHYLGILTSQPTSADALRASEASLTARAEQRQLAFGKAFETVGKLLLSIATGRAVDSIDLHVVWAPADTRSEAQVSDSVTKLVAQGILSRSGALRRMGYSEAEIERELADIRRDAQIGSDVRLGRYLGDLSTNDA